MRLFHWFLILAFFSVVTIGISLTLTEVRNKDKLISDIQLSLQNIEAKISLQTEKEQTLRKIRDFILQSNNELESTEAFEIASLLWKMSVKYPSVDIWDATALAFAESRFERSAISPVGALGLWQVMPVNLRLLCKSMGWEYYHGLHEDDLETYAECTFVFINIIQTEYEGNDRWIVWNTGRTGWETLPVETQILLANFEEAREAVENFPL